MSTLDHTQPGKACPMVKGAYMRSFSGLTLFVSWRDSAGSNLRGYSHKDIAVEIYPAHLLHNQNPQYVRAMSVFLELMAVYRPGDLDGIDREVLFDSLPPRAVWLSIAMPVRQ
jgi:hypothetical protein